VEHNPHNIGTKDYFYRSFYKNNVTGLISDKIYDLMEDDLTVNRGYLKRHRNRNKAMVREETLFNEISVVPHEEVLPSYWRDLMKVKPLSAKTTFDDFVDGLRESMLKFIYENWDSNKFHFMLHSSGWDSRTMSAVMRVAYENLGAEAFGDFVFVCWGDEVPVFKKIMERKGWKKVNYITLHHHDDAFYSYFFDFKKLYKYLNGTSSYPLNEIYWALDILRGDERIPDDDDKIEMWFSSHANRVFSEVIWQKENIIQEYSDKNFYDISSNYYSAMPCKVVIPIINYYTMKHIMESDFKPKKGIKQRISRKLNPELRGLPRVRIPTGQVIPKKYQLKMMKDYNNSWYAQNLKPEATPYMLIRHNNWWLHWSAAALIDYAISKGINVE